MVFENAGPGYLNGQNNLPEQRFKNVKHKVGFTRNAKCDEK
jgi:hypothetical protein